MSASAALGLYTQHVPTSALNSVNSSPLQSNSRMFTVLGGSVCSYVAGAALMFAECSLYDWVNRCRHKKGQGRETLQFLHFQTKLASPRLPLMSFCSKRLTETKLGCVSRQEVHWTLNM